MSERIAEIFLFDIYVAILKIDIVLEQYPTLDELETHFMGWDSIMREFEIIGEATNILIKELILSNRYRGIVDFRNRIAHHYFGIDPYAVWDVVTRHLPLFKNEIFDLIKGIPEPLRTEIITDSITDLAKLPALAALLKNNLQ